MKTIKILAILCLAGQYNSFAQNATIKGFTASSAGKQSQAEQAFDKELSNVRIGQHIKELAARPHHLGSPGGKAVAQAVLQKFKQYGWDAQIETYQVLFPTPKTRSLELIYPTKYTAKLKEPAFAEDATSGQDGQLPTYNAWGADGDVTGDLVFVNYGLPDDYTQLAKLGIDVKGKIVIAKYGRSWRGIKPKVAYEHGAIGCIIYSDPKDDGFYQGEVYPKGPFKNDQTVQRGSVMDMVIYPGDPLTPDVGATAKAKRLNRSDAQTILKIPVLPISYGDAQPLLAALGGPVAPAEWRGALPITYHVGPGKARVHLKIDHNWDIVPAYNVIAKIKGSQYPDQWVIRGNHHDAWVNGADDPISGLAAELEEARSIGLLVKAGIKPKRTLVYCVWDGEEPSLLGSTEWVEDHAEELRKKAVAYINSDGNSRGFLGAGGSHALEVFTSEIAKSVTDPQTGVSVFERKRANDAVRASSAKAQKAILKQDTLSLSALGTGSDYSAFLQHLGIPTLNLGYGGEDAGGDYHSIYDSYDDYVRFKDSSFVYGVALAQTAGRAVLRLANADVLPFDFTSLTKVITQYETEVKQLTDQLRERYTTDALLASTNSYKLAADPKERYTAPEVRPAVPTLDLSPFDQALARLKRSATALNAVSGTALTDQKVAQRFNQAVYQAEKGLLVAEGLPKRPWYRHSIYAPGFYTGYGVKTLPGIREAIEQNNWEEARQQIAVAAKAIDQLSTQLDHITQGQ
ncbi:M28 family peptidase [Mucilaginibacter daejeonensis]|uniref:transferrin receptor-like dimerization domain-containing protein n=1 Tax=Mucilaginibacter daejeonensis TaxID=398049 RepID=UPI001D17A7E9|nr:transferrin receptor-like dimerization domain-containing protein [Mucilaginibacter daejeonensis]UEG54820.1 M28 family peptidase [Mucilaginibacter daejeonensis]